MEKSPEDQLAAQCGESIDAMGRMAGAMKADLEEVRPWSPEVADLAGSTASNLDDLAAAAADKTSERGKLATKAAVELQEDFNAWSAYLK